MQLPRKLTIDLMQTRWAAILDPLISNNLNNVSILQSVSLVTGANVINHLLGKKQQGWFLTDINAPITLYRSAEFNDLTLTLTASGPAVVNIGVF